MGAAKCKGNKPTACFKYANTNTIHTEYTVGRMGICVAYHTNSTTHLVLCNLDVVIVVALHDKVAGVVKELV